MRATTVIQLCLVLLSITTKRKGIITSATEILSTNDAVTPGNLLAQNNIVQDDSTVSNSLRAVSEQLERFNSLYIGKLEARMMSVATLLGNIDSNIKNLQERAHVWDTFQLHVSAWNEQIKALDKKVDLLSRGQERFPVFDGKVTQLLSVEPQLARITARLDEIDGKMTGMAKAIDENGNSESTAPLFSEFAARGMLSTLKGIERKVDKLVAHGKAEERASSDAAHSGKLVVRCQTPPSLEALLHDVAAKVDVLFDRLPDEASGEVDLRSGDSALLSRAFRRLASPLRRTWRALESVEKAVRGSEETNSVLRQGQEEIMNIVNQTIEHTIQGAECCQAHREAAVLSRENVEITLSELKDALSNASQEREQYTLHLEELIIEQSASWNTSFCPLTSSEEISSEEMSSKEHDEDLTTSKTFDEDLITSAPTVYQWLCHELEPGSISGITSPVGEEIIEDNVEVNSELDLLYCDQDNEGGGWTVIQRRGEYGDPQENFTRSWEDYKNGFGDLRREFWAGNEFLHRATNGDRPLKLRVELQDFDGNTSYAEYTIFRVGSESTQYRLRVSGYSGNASDSLGAHNGVAFSTVDRDNDDAPECCPCAPAYGGGWWFYSCFEANLNGEYHSSPEENSYFRGIIWEHWRGDYSLAFTEMKIRPLNYRGIKHG